MICPYLNKQMTQVVFSYDDKDKNIYGQILQQTYVPPQCVKEDCAAWNAERQLCGKTK